MGIQWSTGTIKMMKSIVFAALVAAAFNGFNSFVYGARPYGYNTYNHGAYPYHAIGKRSADADADAFYGSYGYASPAFGYNGFNGFNSYAYGANPYGYNAYNYGAYPYHAIGKRSADADADAYYGSYG